MPSPVGILRIVTPHHLHRCEGFLFLVMSDQHQGLSGTFIPKPYGFIYMLTDNGIIVYVGQTMSHPAKRVAQHARDKQFTNYTYEEWDIINLNERERELIDKHRPKYNISLNPDAFSKTPTGPFTAADLVKKDKAENGLTARGRIKFTTMMKPDIIDMLDRIAKNRYQSKADVLEDILKSHFETILNDVEQ